MNPFIYKKEYTRCMLYILTPLALNFFKHIMYLINCQSLKKDVELWHKLIMNNSSNYILT
jgi:hypothetical protein